MSHKPIMNFQPVEKETIGDGKTLDVVSIFKTIQGEGPFAGHPAIFIRLAGCNLQCPWCDTNYTGGRREMSLDTIMSQINHLSRDRFISLIVITGGEPFRQRIGPLVSQLFMNYHKVQIETNGTVFDPHFIEDAPYNHPKLTVVISPKTPKIAREFAMYLPYIFYKYIIKAGEVAADGLPTSSLGMTCGVARPDPKFRTWSEDKIYIQPMDEEDPEKNKANEQAAIESCYKHGYILSYQLHKALGLE